MMVSKLMDPVQRKTGTILVVEDDASLRRLTQVQLDKLGYQTRVAVDVGGGLDVLRQEAVELVICDLHLPAGSGLELLKTVRAEHPGTKFVIVTAYGSVNTAIEAMKSGAYDYLTKPLHPVELRALVERVFEQQRLADEVQMLRSNVDRKYDFKTLIGGSEILARVIELASRAARTDATVLITGETGTGKELLAKAIHFNSARRDGPFITVNCGSIPRELVESELFGHVKGAFTGALVHKQGRAEMAEGGTLFLDEIGEMPPEMQVRLLRLIQEGEVQKVGATSMTRVDVRIISATHRNLDELIEGGRFREDLFYRLSVVPIELPALRNRREDIPELVQHFFRESTEKHNRKNLLLPASLLVYFSQYDWPGNIRQLANAIVRLVVLAPGPEITLSDLPEFLQKSGPTPTHASELRTGDRTLDDIERRAVLEAMEKFKWNQTHAARYLDISRKILRGRLERYRIKKPPIPPSPE
jgi:two-component system, NtrC family, response regulator